VNRHRDTLRIAITGWLALAGFAAMASVAQTTRVDVQGPTYRWAKLREKEIEGVRLSMTPEQAVQALEARGYRNYWPNAHADFVLFKKQERDEDFSLYLATIRGNQVIRSFTYSRYIGNDDPIDSGFGREEVLRFLGDAPTTWVQHLEEPEGGMPGRVFEESFTYAPEYGGFRLNREDARRCLRSWQCEALDKERDCRPVVQNLRGGSIHGSFNHDRLVISVDDDELGAAQLLEDRAFREFDLSDAICPHPSVCGFGVDSAAEEAMLSP
jgi:hypothetical protein